MTSRSRLIALIALSVGTLVPFLAAAQPAGAADVTFGAGTFTANTTALTLSGPSFSVSGVNVGGVAVYTFGNITIPSTATIVAMGSRPFELVATGTLTDGGAIVSDGTNATKEVPGPNAGGAGGGAGGTDDTTAGGGPGGGGHASTESNGGGGGGFAAAGAPGGLTGTGTVGSGGLAYGNLDLALSGGSGGAGATSGGPGASVGGGGGGGAIGLFGTSIDFQQTAVVVAAGGNGAGGQFGASGGGSGGAILVHAKTIQLNGIFVAPGGQGGGGGCCGDGGGGAGGRIAFQFKTLTSGSALESEVVGGTSGTAGTFGHGGLSAQVSGGAGSMTFEHIDASQLSAGASRSVPKGSMAIVSTRLIDGGTGNGIANASVGLYRRMVPSGVWTLVITKTTSASALATVTVKVNASVQYQWRYAGAFIHDPATSPIQALRLRPMPRKH